MKDFLEQLAELEVRPPPPEFDRQLHQRVNRSLVARHVLDFMVGVLPGALLHFLRAVLAVCAFSITGKFAERRPEKEE